MDELNYVSKVEIYAKLIESWGGGTKFLNLIDYFNYFVHKVVDIYHPVEDSKVVCVMFHYLYWSGGKTSQN